MKQSYRHIFLILGTILTIFGLLMFSYDEPLKPSNVLAVMIMFAGMTMLYKMLNTAHDVKPNKVNLKESIFDLEHKKNKFKDDKEVTLNDKYKDKL